jgi:hypothetical protein
MKLRPPTRQHNKREKAAGLSEGTSVALILESNAIDLALFL